MRVWRELLGRLMGRGSERKAAVPAPRGLAAVPGLVDRMRQVIEAEGGRLVERDGEVFADFRTEDRLFRLRFSIEASAEGPCLRISEVISTPEFSRLVALIESGTGAGAEIEPLDFPASGGVPVAALDEAGLRLMVTRAREVAAGEAVAAHLDRLAALPPTCAGALPLRHLAALVLRGEVARLDNYAAAFAQGDRLGFVPYIMPAMIDRAAAAARARPQPTGGAGC